MSKQSTKPRHAGSSAQALHPHFLWCFEHDEVSDGRLCHLSDSESIGLREGGALEVQLERTTHLAADDTSQEEPRIYLAERAGTGGVRLSLGLSLGEAAALRAALGECMRKASTPLIPADDEGVGRPDRCPPWCLGRDDDSSDGDWHFEGYHVGHSVGPENWFVRRALLKAPGDSAPQAVLWEREERGIELAYGDDTPIALDAPTARSLAAALVHVADEVERHA